MALSIREAALSPRDERNEHTDPQSYPADAKVYVSVGRISGPDRIDVKVQVLDGQSHTTFPVKFSRWVTVLEGNYAPDSDETAFGGKFTIDADRVGADGRTSVRVVVAREGETGANNRYRVSIASKSS